MSFTVKDNEGIQALDRNVIAQSLSGNGVVSGCGVSINTGTLGTGGNALTVGSGSIKFGSTAVSVSSQSLDLDTGDSSNPRKDVVYLNSSGTATVRKGQAEQAQPTGAVSRNAERPAPDEFDDFDSVGVPIAEVWVPAGATSVSSSDISDVRLAPAAIEKDGSTILRDNESATITAPWTFNSITMFNEQDSTNEGGEFILDGAGSYDSIHLDNFQGNLRVFTGEVGDVGLDYDPDLGELKIGGKEVAVLGENETVTGDWTFSGGGTINSQIDLRTSDPAGNFIANLDTSGGDDYVVAFRINDAGTHSDVSWERNAAASVALEVLDKTNNNSLFKLFEGGQLDLPTGALNITGGGASISGGSVNITGTGNTLTIGGSEVWHPGNFDPSTKADLSGATFTGTVEVGSGPIAIKNNGSFSQTVNSTTNEVFRLGGSTSDYLIQVQGGNGRIAKTWNTYYDGTDYRSIVSGEGVSFIGQNESWATPLGANAGTVSIGRADGTATAGEIVTLSGVYLDTDNALKSFNAGSIHSERWVDASSGDAYEVYVQGTTPSTSAPYVRFEP